MWNISQSLSSSECLCKWFAGLGTRPLPEVAIMIQMTLQWHSKHCNVFHFSIQIIGAKFNVAPFCSNLIQFIISGPVVAMELTGDEAICIWRTLLGPPDSAAARQEAPQSIRAKFGTDAVRNVCHGSESLAAAARVRKVLPKVTLCPGLRRPLCPFPEIMVNLRRCVCVFVRSSNSFSLPR